MAEFSEKTEILLHLKKVSELTKDRDFKSASSILNRLNLKFPNNPQIIEAINAFKEAVKQAKIQKLQEEAVALMSSGGHEQAQHKLRQIYKLDPTRKDVEASLEKTTTEVLKEHSKNTQKHRLINTAIKSSIAAVVLLIGILGYFSIKSHSHLKKAEYFLERHNFEKTRLYLEKSKMFFGDRRNKLEKQIVETVDELILKSESYLLDEKFDLAISYLKKAQRGTNHPEEIQEKIFYIEKQKQDRLVFLAAKREKQNKAQKFKDKCSKSYQASIKCKANIELTKHWKKANAILQRGNDAFAKENYDAAIKLFEDATVEFDLAESLVAEKILALSSKADCLTVKKELAGILFFELAQEKYENIAVAEEEAEQEFKAFNFAKSKAIWDQTKISYDQLREEIIVSDDYAKAIAKLGKWEKLKQDLNEEDVIKFLGYPKYIQYSSNSARWYYQQVPKTQMKSGVKSCCDVDCGFVEFDVVGIRELEDRLVKDRDEKLRDENVINEKAVAREINKHSSRSSNAKKKKESEDRIKAEERENNRHTKAVAREQKRHSDAIRRINSDYADKIRDLTAGLLPRKPIYKVSRWAIPDKSKIAELNRAPQDRDYKPQFKWHIESNWRGLKLNVEQNDVHRILGLPDETEDSDFRVHEYYGDVEKYGVIIFERRGDGKLGLSYWSEPFWIDVKDELSDQGNENINSLSLNK